MATKTKSKKKPTWGAVTFKQIEARRNALGLSKAKMAEALGVTNSTFHNWQRGTTVPHANQQEVIAETLGTLEARVNGSAKPRAATKRKTTAKRKAQGTKKGRKSPRTVARTTGDVGGGTTPMTPTFPTAHPLYPADDATVRGIAQITSAWISSQGKAPSAGSVYKFVDGLKERL